MSAGNASGALEANEYGTNADFSDGNEEHGCYESITAYAIYEGQSHKYESSA